MAALLRRAATSLPRHLAATSLPRDLAAAAATRSPPSALRRRHYHSQIQIPKTCCRVGSTALLMSITALVAVHMAGVHMVRGFQIDAEEDAQARMDRIKAEFDSMVKHAADELADEARRTRSAED